MIMQEKSITEYLSQFSHEIRVLTVRISWFPGQVHPKADELEDRYRVKARFDQAIDEETQTIIGEHEFNWLEWLVKPGLFKDPFGFKMEVGKLYRVAVRTKEKVNPTDANIYYLESMLDRNVKDDRLDPYLTFMSQYEDKETELVVLNKKKVMGWGHFWQFCRFGLTGLGWINPASDAFEQKTIHLTCLDKENGDKLRYPFMELTPYRFRVKNSREKDNAYLITKILGPVTDSRFDAFIEEYRKPVVLDTPYGTFTLNRDYDWFEGEVSGFSGPASVLLNTEEEDTDVSVSLERLAGIMKDPAGYEKLVKQYISDEMYDSLEDWFGEPITRAEFMDRLTSPCVSFDQDGSLSFMYDSGELFCYHSIIVTIEPDDSFSSADLAG